MAQISEAKLFEWMGRLYAERQNIAEERDEARLTAAKLVEHAEENVALRESNKRLESLLAEAQAKKRPKKDK